MSLLATCFILTFGHFNDRKTARLVAIELVGEAPVLDAVPGSIINHVLNEIEIEALPADMPERIEVDISKLETAEDLINVADPDLGDKITVLTDETELVVSLPTLPKRPNRKISKTYPWNRKLWKEARKTKRTRNNPLNHSEACLQFISENKKTCSTYRRRSFLLAIL